MLKSLVLSGQERIDTAKAIKGTSICTTDHIGLAKRPLRTVSKGTMLAYSNCKVRDDGHSPLLYRGPELYLRYFRERQRRLVNTRIEADLVIGNLRVRKKQTYYRTSLLSFRADLNYHVLFSLSNEQRKFRWQLGPMLGNTVDTRLYSFLPNNSFSYEFANYIGLSAAVRHQHEIGKRSFNFSWRSHIALLAHVIRPNFIGMEPAVLYEGPEIRILPIFFHENKIVLPGKFFHLRSELSADLIRPGKRDLKIFYAWSVTVDRVSNPLVQAKHCIGIGRTITKSKRRSCFGKGFFRINKSRAAESTTKVIQPRV